MFLCDSPEFHPVLECDARTSLNFYPCFNDPATMQMVAGRFVNAYSTNDWTLGITFRARYV